MTIDNMAGRAAATILGLALAAGGASLLFGDVIFGTAAFTQKHFQTIAIVLGTTIAAFVAHKAWTNRPPRCLPRFCSHHGCRYRPHRLELSGASDGGCAGGERRVRQGRDRALRP